eukprot:m.129226 g.129226  ORF g.129226 m.129226 type:complete len:478 (-) comp16753_c1_seq5:134-1567(-)
MMSGAVRVLLAFVLVGLTTSTRDGREVCFTLYSDSSCTGNARDKHCLGDGECEASDGGATRQTCNVLGNSVVVDTFDTMADCVSNATVQNTNTFTADTCHPQGQVFGVKLFGTLECEVFDVCVDTYATANCSDSIVATQCTKEWTCSDTTVGVGVSSSTHAYCNANGTVVTQVSFNNSDSCSGAETTNVELDTSICRNQDGAFTKLRCREHVPTTTSTTSTSATTTTTTTSTSTTSTSTTSTTTTTSATTTTTTTTTSTSATTTTSPAAIVQPLSNLSSTPGPNQGYVRATLELVGMENNEVDLAHVTDVLAFVLRVPESSVYMGLTTPPAPGGRRERAAFGALVDTAVVASAAELGPLAQLYSSVTNGISVELAQRPGFSSLTAVRFFEEPRTVLPSGEEEAGSSIFFIVAILAAVAVCVILIFAVYAVCRSGSKSKHKVNRHRSKTAPTIINPVYDTHRLDKRESALSKEKFTSL